MILVKYPLLFLSWLIYILPQPIKDLFAWMIGIIWFDILRVRRSVPIKNIERVFPEFTKKQTVSMARKSLFHMGLTLIEFFSMPFLNTDKFRQVFEVEGEEKFKKAFEQNKGVFMLSVHLGNGDMAGAALASWGYPIHIISKVFKSSWLNKLWFASREAKGVRFIPPRKSSYEILKALKQNHAVVFVLDQYTGPPNGVLTKFFGIETGTAAGLALFAQRSGAPVLPCYTYRLSSSRYKIICKDPIEFEEKASKDETIRFMTEKYNREVEKAILEAPEQWMWVHRRWKHGFVGQKPIES